MFRSLSHTFLSLSLSLTRAPSSLADSLSFFLPLSHPLFHPAATQMPRNQPLPAPLALAGPNRRGRSPCPPDSRGFRAPGSLPESLSPCPGVRPGFSPIFSHCFKEGNPQPRAGRRRPENQGGRGHAARHPAARLGDALFQEAAGGGSGAEVWLWMCSALGICCVRNVCKSHMGVCHCVCRRVSRRCVCPRQS